MRSSDLLRRFAAYYRPHRGLFILGFACAVVAGLIALAAVGLLVAYMLSAGLRVIVGGICSASVSRRRCAGKAFDHLQKLSFGFFDDNKTGHLVARLTKDLEEIGEVAHHGPEDLFIAVMTLLGAFALMLWVHVQLAVTPASWRR